jgi:rSAM/selenodomain-associated transferase 1
MGLGPATALYRRMLEDTLATCSQVVAHNRELWIDQPDPHPVVAEMANRLGMSVHAQSGDGLGSRMHAAFAATLRNADSAVLIGSDCPEYDPPYLDAAFQALEQHDAVLGPAADGGYVLIGLRKADPHLFHRVPWGTNRVLAATRLRLRYLQWSFVELPIKYDVDKPEDLLRFPHLASTAEIECANGSGE